MFFFCKSNNGKLKSMFHGCIMKFDEGKLLVGLMICLLKRFGLLAFGKMSYTQTNETLLNTKSMLNLRSMEIRAHAHAILKDID